MYLYAYLRFLHGKSKGFFLGVLFPQRITVCPLAMIMLPALRIMAYSSGFLKVLVLGPLYYLKLLSALKNFCLCGVYLMIFILLQIKAEKTYEIFNTL